MKSSRRKEIDEAVAKASPGPWSRAQYRPGRIRDSKGIIIGDLYFRSPDDTALCIDALKTIEELLAEVDRLTELVDFLETAPQKEASSARRAK